MGDRHLGSDSYLQSCEVTRIWNQPVLWTPMDRPHALPERPE